MSADLGHYVGVHGAAGRLVVQPRMGLADPEAMAAGIAAVAGLDCPTVGTVTLDSYTRVGDHAAAPAALRVGRGAERVPDRRPRARATRRWSPPRPGDDFPVQVRHGSAAPGRDLRRGWPKRACTPPRAARCRTACPTAGRRWSRR